jgi:hypothetical protein
MSDVMLPAPPVVIQESRMGCWAAAYESWNRANESEFGVGGVADATKLKRSLGTLSGHFHHSGGLTPNRMLLLGNIGIMRSGRLRGRQVNVQLIAIALAEGYVYCTYYTQRIAHAILIYGVRGATVFAMHPWFASKWLVELPVSSFADKVAVLFGTPLLATLAHDLDTVTANLRETAIAR